MEIRLITKETYERFLKISAASFMWKFDPKDEDDGEPSKPCYGAFVGDKLVAEVEVNEFQANFCGRLLPVIGIGGVASMPEERRGGAVREIFKELERIAPEKGWAMGFLYPFSVKYYEQFGYAMAHRFVKLTVPFHCLGSFARSCDVTLFEGENKQELYDVYNRCAMSENLMTMRNSMTYFNDKPFESGEYTYIFRKNGEARGFVSFNTDRKVGVMYVTNLVFADKEALLALIGFLRNYDGVVKSLQIDRLAVDSPVLSLFNSTPEVHYEMHNGAASRIYDLEGVLKSNAYPRHAGSFRLKCTDSMPQNNGVFTVNYKNGAADVTKSDAGEWDISLTATAAAHLLLSGNGFDAAHAAYIDGVELNNSALDFFAAFPKRSTNFVDGF